MKASQELGQELPRNHVPDALQESEEPRDLPASGSGTSNSKGEQRQRQRQRGRWQRGQVDVKGRESIDIFIHYVTHSLCTVP
jgi:hypothetical protein